MKETKNVENMSTLKNAQKRNNAKHVSDVKKETIYKYGHSSIKHRLHVFPHL